MRKDLRVLRRSPLLLGVLLAYPLVIAAMVGLVAAYANAKPRVAFVDEDGLPAQIEVGGRTFHVEETIDRVATEVTLVRLDREEAERQLRSGRIVALLAVPDGFVGDLRSLARSPRLELETTSGGISIRVTQQVQALVYQLNRQLEDAYVGGESRVHRVAPEGWGGNVPRAADSTCSGWSEPASCSTSCRPGRGSIGCASSSASPRLALGETDDALRATANPIELVQTTAGGRSWALSAQAQSHALALTISFLALLLAAAALAAERDEGALGPASPRARRPR